MHELKMTEEKALELITQGIDCSQAVLGEFSEDFGMSQETAYRIAGNFAGGMWNGRTCGCVSGALMALGLRYGQGLPVDPAKKEKLQKIAKQFEEEFIDELGSVECREILGYKIPEEMPQIMAENKFGTVCCKAVVTACEIAADLMEEE